MIQGNNFDLIIFDELTETGDYWDKVLLQVASFKEIYEENTLSTYSVPFTYEAFTSRRYGVPVPSA